MKRKSALLLVILTACVCSCAEERQPVTSDMMAFFNNAEDCQHFSGKWDSELLTARKKEIEENINVSCGKAKIEREALKKKYAGNKKIEAQLNEYDL